MRIESVLIYSLKQPHAWYDLSSGWYFMVCKKIILDDFRGGGGGGWTYIKRKLYLSD